MAAIWAVNSARVVAGWLKIAWTCEIEVGARGGILWAIRWRVEREILVRGVLELSVVACAALVSAIIAPTTALSAAAACLVRKYIVRVLLRQPGVQFGHSRRRT